MLRAETGIAGTLLSSGGNVDVQSRTGGIAIAESNAVGILALQAAQDITGDLAYTETGDITIASTSGAVNQTQVSSGSDVSISAGTDIGVGIVYAPGDHGSGSAALTAESGGITFDTISTLGDTALRAETGIVGTLLSSGGNVDVQSRTGGIVFASIAALGHNTLTAESNIMGDLLFAGGNLQAQSRAGAISIAESSAGQNINFDTSQDLSVTKILSDASINLRSRMGAITITDTVASNAALTLHGKFNVNVATAISGGPLRAISDAGDLRINRAAALGSLTLTAARDIRAGLLIGIDGLVLKGRDILLDHGLTNENLSITASRDVAGKTNAAALRLESENDIAVSAGRNITSSFVGAGRNATLYSSQGRISGNQIFAGNAAHLSARQAVMLGGLTAAGSSLTIVSRAAGISSGGDLVSLGTLTLSAAQGITAQSDIEALGALVLNADSGAISGQNIRSNQAITITALSANIAGDVASRGNLTVQTAQRTNVGGTVAALNDVSIIAGTTIGYGAMLAGRDAQLTSGSGAISLHKTTYAGRDLALDLGTADLNLRAVQGSVAADGTLSVTARSLNMANGTFAFGGFTALLSGSANLSGATLYTATNAGGNGNVSISATDLTLTASSRILAEGNIALSLSRLTNPGMIAARGTTLINVSGNLTNNGVLYGGTDLGLFAGGTLTNSANSLIQAGRDLVIAKNAGLANLQSVVNDRGRIEAGRDLVIAANSITNKAGNNITVTTETVSGTADFQGPTQADIDQAFSDPQGLADAIKRQTIDTGFMARLVESTRYEDTSFGNLASNWYWEQLYYLNLYTHSPAGGDFAAQTFDPSLYNGARLWGEADTGGTKFAQLQGFVGRETPHKRVDNNSGGYDLYYDYADYQNRTVPANLPGELVTVDTENGSDVPIQTYFSGDYTAQLPDGSSTRIVGHHIDDVINTGFGLSGSEYANSVNLQSKDFLTQRSVVGDRGDIIGSATFVHLSLQYSLTPGNFQSGSVDYTETRQVLSGDTQSGVILSGRDMQLKGGTIRNDLSVVRADGDLAMTGSTLANTGRTVQTQFSYTCNSRVECHVLNNVGGIDFTIAPGDNLSAVKSRQVGATITSGGALTGTFTNQIDNQNIAPNTGSSETFSNVNFNVAHVTGRPQLTLDAINTSVASTTLSTLGSVDALAAANGVFASAGTVSPGNLDPNITVQPELSVNPNINANLNPAVNVGLTTVADPNIDPNGYQAERNLTSVIDGIDIDARLNTGDQLQAAVANALKSALSGADNPLGGLDLPVAGISKRTKLANVELKPQLRFDDRYRKPAGHTYLYETRAPFIDVSRFYGSHYYTSRIGYDPDHQLYFLGDAYFETKLVEDSLLKHTGKRLIETTASSAEEQMKILIDNGVEVADNLNLTPGVELTKEQASALTSNIVWYVKKKHKGKEVLVPQVYLAHENKSVVNESGALIAGRSVDLRSRGSLTNTGRISGDDAVTLVTVSGDIINDTTTADVGLRGGGTMSIIGARGKIDSGGSLILASGKSVQINGSVIEAENADISGREGVEFASVTLGISTIREERTNLADRGGILRGAPTRHGGGSTTGIGGSTTGGRGTTGGVPTRYGSVPTRHGGAPTRWGEEYEIAYGADVSTTENLTVTSSGDISSTAADLSAGGDIVINAKGSINILAGTDSRYKATRSRYRWTREEQITHQGSTLDALGSITLSAGADIKIAGSALAAGGGDTADGDGDGATGSGGDINLVGRRIDIAAVENSSLMETRFQRKKSGLFGSKSKSYKKQSYTEAQGSLVDAAGDLTVISSADTTITASGLYAGGDLGVYAGYEVGGDGVLQRVGLADLRITGAQNDFEQIIRRKSSGLFRKKSYSLDEAGDSTTASTLTAGGNITLDATRDTTLTASVAQALGDITVLAGRDVTLDEMANGYRREEISKSSGLGGFMSAQGSSVTFGVGYMSQKSHTKQTEKTNAVSSLAAGGDLTIDAGRDITLKGAQLSSGGVATLQAERNVDILDVTNASSYYESHSSTFIGLQASFSSNLYSAYQAGKKLVGAVEGLGGNNKFAAYNVAFAGMRAYDAIQAAASPPFSMSVGVAFSTSTSKSQSSQTQSVGSSIYGEEGVSILAGSGDIRAVGAQIASLGDISLGAGRDILLSSGASSFASSSKSSNAGGFLGVTISPPGFGTEAGVGFSGNLNAGTTKQNASGTTHQNTNVSGANVTLYSGRDTVLKGARVEGEDITATVGRDLTIESVRNTGQMSQSGVRLGLAFGGPLNGPLSLSSITPGFDWGKGTTNWVGTQSGLVGTGTVDVYVHNHTDLKGGIIASTSCLALPPDGCLSAGGDTKLDTGTLSYEHFNDIEKSQSLSLDLNLNAGLFTGERSLFDQDGGLPGEWGKPSNKKTGTNVALEGTYDLIDRAQSVKATVGQGTITIRNQEDQTQDLANLNRDPDLSQVITKDVRGHLDIYVSDSSLKAAFEAVEIIGESITSIVDGVLGELGNQGNKTLAELAEAKKNGLLSDKDLVDQLAECGGFQRQGFNLWNLLVGKAHAAGGCVVTLVDGRKIHLSEDEKDTCLKVYLIAAWNASKSVGDKETARGFAESIKEKISGDLEHYQEVAHLVDAYLRGPQDPDYAEARAYIDALWRQTKQFAYDVVNDPAGTLKDVAVEEIAAVQGDIFNFVGASFGGDNYAIGAAAGLLTANTLLKVLRRIRKGTTVVGEQGKGPDGKWLPKDGSDRPPGRIHEEEVKGYYENAGYDVFEQITITYPGAKKDYRIDGIAKKRDGSGTIFVYDAKSRLARP